ncbi:unnamed protein product, partial [Ectocarpus sp. 12 AP-2014]
AKHNFFGRTHGHLLRAATFVCLTNKPCSRESRCGPVPYKSDAVDSPSQRQLISLSYSGARRGQRRHVACNAPLPASWGRGAYFYGKENNTMTWRADVDGKDNNTITSKNTRRLTRAQA